MNPVLQNKNKDLAAMKMYVDLANWTHSVQETLHKGDLLARSAGNQDSEHHVP